MTPAAEQFRLVLEAAPIGMLMVDEHGCISLVNAQIEKLFGYPRDELIGMQVENLVPPRFRARFFRHPENRSMGAGRDLYALRKDGTEVPVEIGFNPLVTPTGTFVLSSIVDISERRHSIQQLSQRTEALAATLREREVLLREIHHRVKNNLQIITSLISMQIRRLESGPSRDILNECKTRVDAIALIHEKLYQSRDFTNVPFAIYARGLVQTIMQASGAALDRIEAEFRIEDLTLPVDQAIPCGLILNELVTNSLKHAFPHDRRGRIRICLSRIHDTSLRFEVSDDGIGLRDFDVVSDRTRIGLSLVASLADQLNEQLHIDTGPRALVRIDFPLQGRVAVSG